MFQWSECSDSSFLIPCNYLSAQLNLTFGKVIAAVLVYLCRCKGAVELFSAAEMFSRKKKCIICAVLFSLLYPLIVIFF